MHYLLLFDSLHDGGKHNVAISMTHPYHVIGYKSPVVICQQMKVLWLILHQPQDVFKATEHVVTAIKCGGVGGVDDLHSCAVLVVLFLLCCACALGLKSESETQTQAMPKLTSLCNYNATQRTLTSLVFVLTAWWIANCHPSIFSFFLITTVLCF